MLEPVKPIVAASTLLLILGVACHEPAPAATPAEASPPSASDNIVSLEARVWRPRLLGVERPMDVVIPANEGVARNDIWQCPPQGCVLACVQPSERIEVQVDAPRDLTIRALQLPEPRELSEGATLRFPLTPVGADDPRGLIADVMLTLDEPGVVTLEWRSVHVGAKHGPPHFVDLELFGAGGPVHTWIHGAFPDSLERHKNSYRLDAGTARIRLTPDLESKEIICSPAPFPGADEVRVPAWCELPDCGCAYEVELTWVSTEPLTEPLEPPPQPARPPDVHLVEGTTVVALEREPDPTKATFAVTPGNDVVLRWEPTSAALSYAWEVNEDHWSRGICEEHACRFHRAPFQTVDVILGNREEPERVDVEAYVLPPPPSEFVLQPGTVADAWLDPIAPGDPRGPLLDVDLDIPEPGRYRVGVRYTAGEPHPYIEVLGSQPALQDTMLQYLGADPYQAAIYDVAAAGVYPIRVVTCPDCADQQVQVELQREDG